MAIKIIKQGRSTKPIYVGRCRDCKCEFEFERQDAIRFLDSQIEGQEYELKCPNCGRIIWVKKEILRYERD